MQGTILSRKMARWPGAAPCHRSRSPGPLKAGAARTTAHVFGALTRQPGLCKDSPGCRNSKYL